MNKYAKQAKKCIFKIISQIAASPHPFLFDPRSFSRKRKLGISVLFRLILSIGSNSLNYEIGNFFQYRQGFPSSSAFVQQRQKLSYTAFEYAFHQFQEQTCTVPLLFKGFRLLALDGTELSFLPEPSPSPADSPPVSKLHLNGLFDLLGKSFADVLVQDAPLLKDEVGAACDIVDRVTDKYPAIFLADRNYESYNFFAHVEERLFDYVVRIKDINSNGMLSGMDLPDSEEFDITRQVVITRHHSGVTEVFPQKFKYFTKKKRFDYIKDSNSSDYTLTIRFVRFRLPDGTYECLATSLPQEQFSVEDLKKIYEIRWGILYEPCFYTNFPDENALNTKHLITKSSYKVLSLIQESAIVYLRHPAIMVLLLESHGFFCLRFLSFDLTMVTYSSPLLFSCLHAPIALISQPNPRHHDITAFPLCVLVYVVRQIPANHGLPGPCPNTSL